MAQSSAPKLCPGACSDPGKAKMRQEGRRPWGHGGPCENWAIVEGFGHQFHEKSHGWEPAHQQQFSCSAEQHFMTFYINKAQAFLCLFRWNSQLSWEKLVFICFRWGPIETLGVFPSWNTWRKTSGFDPKKALSKKYVKQTWQWIINIPKNPSMWGKKQDWEGGCFFNSKIMGLAMSFLIDNFVSLVQL